MVVPLASTVPFSVWVPAHRPASIPPPARVRAIDTALPSILPPTLYVSVQPTFIVNVPVKEPSAACPRSRFPMYDVHAPLMSHAGAAASAAAPNPTAATATTIPIRRATH